MQKSRTFVKRGRTSTAAIVEELQANAVPDAQTADTLWKLVDKNNDVMHFPLVRRPLKSPCLPS
jgi:hypothetical protein